MENKLPMKKRIFLNSRLMWFQLALSVVGAFTLNQSIKFGEETYSAEGTYTKLVNNEYVEVGTDIAVSTGYNGGSLSMGLITCVCIFSIIWIEIHKMNKK